MRVRVNYVDGTVESADVTDWPQIRPEGVDSVTVYDDNWSSNISAQSLYWLYPEDDCIVFGAGSIRYDPNPLTELVIESNGKQRLRTVPFAPDLMHKDVKLGWWWPGKERPVG